MKKLTTLAVAIAVSLSSPVMAADGIGNVTHFNNHVYQVTEGAKKPKLVRVAPSKIYANDVIKTLEQSTVRLRFKDDTNFSIGEKSQVVLDEFVFDGNPSNSKLTLDIVKGSMRFVTGQMAKEKVVIKTQVAVIGIRGTDVGLVAKKKSLKGQVYQGGIDVKVPNKPAVKVNAGQTFSVGKDGKVSVANAGSNNVTPSYSFGGTSSSKNNNGRQESRNNSSSSSSSN